jgi:mono/diheme cytochrome c family protein
MRRPFLVTGLSSLLALGLAAQVVDPQYQAWMKSMQPSMMAIRNAPDNAAMVGAANKLAATFDQVAMYWKAKQTADAVGFAETARDAAKAIAAGSGEKVANLEKIEQQCGACHMAHRFQRGGDNDPDRAVKGGGLPEGWSVRPDRGTADQIKFAIAGDVDHFAMGPAGTFYRSDWTKSGDYQFSARLTQMKAPTHPISYGLMIGGSDLAGPNQTYSYFLVRNQGEYYVANREGDKRPIAVVTWTAHPVIVKEGADWAADQHVGNPGSGR